MRFNKLIYIRYIPLTEKIYKDFYMEEAVKAGIEVEYWDITALFFKHIFGQEDSSHLVSTRKFDSYKELERSLVLEQPLSNTLFISIMTFEGRIGKLYRILTKYNCKLAVFGRNMFPMPASNSSSIIDRICRITLTKIYDYIRIRNVKQQKLSVKIKEYDILFMGGELGWKGVGNIEYSEITRAEIVKVNSDDYDVYLGIKDSEPLIKGDYILFLDEYLPLHPDTKLFNIKNILPEQYYPELCRYFDRVELQYGMPVVIAAHPKALRYKEEDFFSGRKIFLGKSAELSKFAFFVIAHNTTAINYPVAFGKKIHFITSKNIEKGIINVHRHSICLANYLGCNYQWFDINEPVNLIETLPEANYRRYKYDFQTFPETEHILTKDIFIEFLKKE